MVINFGIVDYWTSFYSREFMAPLIHSISVTVETDRGDSIHLIFTDFYFKFEKTSGIAFQKKVFLKFDPAYGIEPFAKLKFTDIKVEYESTLLPDSYQESSELSSMRSEIDNIDTKIDTIMEILGQKQDSPLTRNKETKFFEKKGNSGNEVEIIKEIIEEFKNCWEEPVLPTVILEIGKKSGNILKRAGS